MYAYFVWKIYPFWRGKKSETIFYTLNYVRNLLIIRDNNNNAIYVFRKISTVITMYVGDDKYDNDNDNIRIRMMKLS